MLLSKGDMSDMPKFFVQRLENVGACWAGPTMAKVLILAECRNLDDNNLHSSHFVHMKALDASKWDLCTVYPLIPIVYP